MNERRRLLKEYIRDEADEELDYFTIISYNYDETPVEIDVWPTRTGGYDDHEYYESEMYYSIDGGEWVRVTEEYATIILPYKHKVRLKNDEYDLLKQVLESGTTHYERAGFGVSYDDYIVVDGTPLSLLHGDNFKERKNDLLPYCFKELFVYSRGVILIRNPKTFLPSTKLATGCYEAMFYNTGIENAPELPADELADGCYLRMFDNCNYLKDAPVLNAKILAPDCYSQMFYDCRVLRYIKIAATENIVADGACTVMLQSAGANKPIIICSQELRDEWFPDLLYYGWLPLDEDYPTNEEGFPKDSGEYDESYHLLFNTKLISWDADFLNYRRREADELSVWLYNFITDNVDVGNSVFWTDYWQYGYLFVDRTYIYRGTVYEDYIYFENIYNDAYMDVYLWKDGVIECYIYAVQYEEV